MKRYCLLLNASGIPVEKAFLYGSYSRGDARLHSDIDVAIVSSAFDTSNDLLKAKAWRLTEHIDIKIEPYTIGLQRFLTDDVSPLLQIVRQEGIEIVL
ncbi:MAG: nucleotidyltransferase domain-containing protein [Bacteroidetes bacterium]|nr:nucleotidyltransferase domain-containing protein [Bacteroidota bacterium]MBU1720465.1 nucleotidyltransferase domain-containing protein [Bacteroidota bacterium]